MKGKARKFGSENMFVASTLRKYLLNASYMQRSMLRMDRIVIECQDDGKMKDSFMVSNQKSGKTDFIRHRNESVRSLTCGKTS